MRSGSAGSLAQRQRGFTYVTVMALVALLGLGLAAVGPLWAESAQREREQELLRIGALYAHAIASYRASAPGSDQGYPTDLNHLLQDPRYLGVRRHMRQLYPDPLMPSRPWGLVRAADGGILGVYSQDARQPWRRAAVEAGTIQLPAARRYDEWKFVSRTDL